MPRTPFIENIQTKEAERPAIIVQEELRRIYVSFFFKNSSIYMNINLFGLNKYIL